METLVVVMSTVSLIIVIVVSIILYIQTLRLRGDFERTVTSMVHQINDGTLYAYKFDKMQENNIKSMDSNIQILHSRLNAVAPDNKYLCIQGTCISKNDLQTISDYLHNSTGVANAI